MPDLSGVEAAGAPALEPDLTRPLPRSLRALAFRDFRRFWLSAVGSNIGNNMQLAALAWVVAVETHSAAKVTLLAFVTVLPLLVLGPVGGALADRFPRRRLLLVTQTALMFQAFTLWGVWELGVARYSVLFALSLAAGLVIALNTPAWQSIVPDLVPRPFLQNAITLNSTQFNVSRAVGPMLAGLLIARVGAGICFLINALSFGLVLIALLGMSSTTEASPAGPRTAPGLVKGFAESVRYLRSDPALIAAISSHAAFALFAAPVVQLIPVLSVEVLHVGPQSFGVLLGSFGVGAVAVAFLLGVVDQFVAPSRLLALGLALAAGSLLGLGLAPDVAVGVLFMLTFGASYVTVVAIAHSVVQVRSGDHIRGRITSLWLMTFGSCFSLGVLLQGVISDLVGVRAVLIACASSVALVLAVVSVRGVLPRIDAPQLSESFRATARQRP